ncbi:MAG: acetylglutamate kinase [Campylobacterales bacterium]
MQAKIETVKVLLEAIPFIQRFAGETIVIKYGGAAQTDERLKEMVARDIVLLSLVGIRVVVVHGGGKSIDKMLEALDIHSEFRDGYRVTSKEAMRIVEMVLSGEINNEIVSLLNYHGARAIGLDGKAVGFLKATPKSGGAYGYTGDVSHVNPEIIDKLLNEKIIPVIAPIAAGDELGHPGFNINADLAASAIAGALGATKILFMTDTPGVLDKEKRLISTLTPTRINELKHNGTISGGMIPKVDACLEALHAGVEKAHIIDGRIEHAILLELFTDEGIGTQIMSE